MKNVLKPVYDILNTLFREGFEKFGKYYSSYRGYVVDNNDPDSLSRLKLVIPQITGKEVMEYWAWPKNNFSGKDYGSQVIPPKGSMVWVEFEMGNPRAPIWEHGHFGFSADGKTNEKPASLRDVKNFWFKTPGGHLIEFDDTNEWVMLTTSKGGKFKFNDKIQLLNGNSPAVLGDKNNETLGAIKDLLSDMNTAFTSIVTQDTTPVSALATATGVTLTYTAVLAAKLASWSTAITNIQTKITNNNSQDIKLK